MAFELFNKIKTLENGHIYLWLAKDLFWISDIKIGGLLMMTPTILLSIYLTWLSKHIISELIHNVSITFWISANSIWMCSEFFNFEDIGKPIATCFFYIGLSILTMYYIFILFNKNKKPLT